MGDSLRQSEPALSTDADTPSADHRADERKPRLGILISMFPELHETFILRELVALERRGVRFEIFSLQYPRDPITLDDAIRLSTEKTSYSGLITTSTLAAFMRTLFSQPLSLLGTIWRTVIEGRDRPADVLKNLAILPLTLHIGELGVTRGITHWHGHWANIPTTACWYLGRIHKRGWSAAIHGEDIFSANRFLRYKLNAAQFSVVCSDYFCQHLQTKLQLANPDKIHLNYHGLDPRVLERAAGIHRQPLSTKSQIKLITIGRLVPTKGHDVLLNACANLKNSGVSLSMQLIGSGPLEDALKSQANELGINDQVSFRGALSFADVLDAMEAADIFCLAPRMIPGQPPDGIPNVIAEAMALGLPVVTTRVSAIPELVLDQQTGCLVEVDDVEAFAEAIRHLAENPPLVTALSSAARERVGQLFNQDANIDELLELFERYVPGSFVSDRLV